MTFEFATAGHIVFGRHALERLGSLAAALGRRALLVTGRTPARARRAVALLEAAGLDVEVTAIDGEPTVEDVRRATSRARRAECDLVVGYGGGSAIDGAKAVAALVANGGDPLDYLEVVGRGQQLARPSLPCIAVPTTAGTGSEVTRNSVLEVSEQRTKVSLRGPTMLPTVALVDPCLSETMPPDVTAYTGFDALAQVIEPFVCCAPNPLTDALAREALPRAGVALPQVCHTGADPEAREQMCLVSLVGGLCLANAKLGAVHGLAGPMGGMFRAPHGALCAALLPHVMRANVTRLYQMSPGSDAGLRFAELGSLLTGEECATADDAIEWVESLLTKTKIPPLRRWGLAAADAAEICAKASKASSMKGNPVVLSAEELEGIVSAAL
ncbi:MAG: iron-containing alcohol dehydrogenase [Polyangiaceae bacterium]|nr:iron-containing alcohol dehydrogenase [Polyangiaceae bacterium]